MTLAGGRVGALRGGGHKKTPSGFTQPDLAGKGVYSGKLPPVVGDEGIAECNGLSGDEQIVAADRLPGLVVVAAPLYILGISDRIFPEYPCREDADAGARGKVG